MSWRTVLICKRAKLEYKMGYLVVRNEEVKRVHLSEISILVVEDTSVSLTASLLCELAKKKIKVIFCDERRNPFAELTNYYGAHDTSLKFREQIRWDKDFAKVVWTEIVCDKIDKQRIHLKDRNLLEHSLLLQYLEEVRINDDTNREGHAAKVYFNALFGKQFSRAGEDAVNGALNYGYSILLSAFNREVVSNGYCTQLGIRHDNMFNYYNLSSDLMEPFRILVDKKVVQMNPTVLDHDCKMELVDILNQQVEIDGKRQFVMNAISIYSKSVFAALGQRDLSLIRLYQHEL